VWLESSRAAIVVRVHTAEQIISVVTVETPDQLSAVPSPWPVVSEALRDADE
jgi:hypothetical protein